MTFQGYLKEQGFSPALAHYVEMSCQGFTYKEMAERRGCTYKAVKVGLTSVYRISRDIHPRAFNMPGLIWLFLPVYVDFLRAAGELRKADGLRPTSIASLRSDSGKDSLRSTNPYRASLTLGHPPLLGTHPHFQIPFGQAESSQECDIIDDIENFPQKNGDLPIGVGVSGPDSI